MNPRPAADSSRSHVVIVANSIVVGGGVANAARAQAQALAEYFDLTVITGHGELHHPQITVLKNKEPRLYWLRRFSHAIREYWFCVRIRNVLHKLHRRQPIDFIIFHSHTGAAIAGLNFREATGVPFAAVTHGDIFSRPAGAYDPLLTMLYRWATAKSYRQCNLIIALSPFMRDAAVKNGANPETVRLIPNGVALKPINEADLLELQEGRSATSAIKLLFVGRLAIEKDLTTLLKGFELALRNNDQLRLTLVGDGPLYQQCVSLCQQLDIEKYVSFAGQLEREKVEQLYCQHDVFCITSISDPLPTVVLEAMHYGLPVIGTEVDGIPFMVSDQQTGCLIPAGAVDHFANAVQLLSRHPWQRTEFGKNGHARVQTTFAWPIVGVQLQSAIATTIARSSLQMDKGI